MLVGASLATAIGVHVQTLTMSHVVFVETGEVVACLVYHTSVPVHLIVLELSLLHETHAFAGDDEATTDATDDAILVHLALVEILTITKCLTFKLVDEEFRIECELLLVNEFNNVEGSQLPPAPK